MAEYAKEKAEKVKKYAIDAKSECGRLFQIVGPNGYKKTWTKAQFIEQVKEGKIVENADGTFSYAEMNKDVVWVK